MAPVGKCPRTDHLHRQELKSPPSHTAAQRAPRHERRTRPLRSPRKPLPFSFLLCREPFLLVQVRYVDKNRRYRRAGRKRLSIWSVSEYPCLICHISDHKIWLSQGRFGATTTDVIGRDALALFTGRLRPQRAPPAAVHCQCAHCYLNSILVEHHSNSK